MTTESESPPFSVSVRNARDGVVVTLGGELDCATAPQLASTLTQLIGEHPPRRLLVDAKRLEFVDVSGLTPLIEAAEMLRPTGSVELRNPGRQLVRVIRLLGLETLLELPG